MEKENLTQNKLNIVIKVLSALCFSFVVIFVIWGFIVAPKLELFYEKADVYDEFWVRECEDGSEVGFKMPMSILLAPGETVTYKTVLPDTVTDGMYLSINTGKCFSMYIDGEEIYSFDNTISKIPGNVTKTVLVPVKLRDAYAGKTLSMVVTNGKYARRTVNTAYIGSLMGIALVYLRGFGIQFIMAILLMLAALITIGIFRYIQRRENKKAPLIHLAEGVLIICLWIIFDSPLFQFVCGINFFDGIAGFMCVLTMAFPFMLYFDEILGYRYHKILAVCELVLTLNFIILTTLHMTGIYGYDKSLIYLDVMLTVYMATTICCVLRDYFRQKNKDHKNVIIGVLGLSIFGVFEIIVTILSNKLPLKVDIGGFCVLTGLVFLMLFAILDQVRVFEKINMETQNAIAATKAKSDFLANMSHEIRTPINAIMGMNEMILRECEQDSIKEYARDINSASENLLEIVNDILDFSKIESGKLDIILDDYDLGELIYDVTTLVNMKAENKGLKLNVIVDKKLPCNLHGDSKRIKEIMTNILNNAVKYTDEGFVNLLVNGKVENGSLALCISVEDSGQGIKKEDLDKIFNGFSQVNAKKNKNVEGTGLGLSITKNLIELMGGTISVESEYGKGSTFTVTLPQKIVSDTEMGNYMLHRHASKDNESGEIRTYDFSKYKILVVDDTALNLKVISKFLAKTNANVTLVSSGEEMLDLIQKESFDIILLDHMMPNMDGIETLGKARELQVNKCKNVPVIALTANAIVGAREMYLKAGFDDYLSKPVKMTELCDTIGTVLSGTSVSQK